MFEWLRNLGRKGGAEKGERQPEKSGPQDDPIGRILHEATAARGSMEDVVRGAAGQDPKASAPEPVEPNVVVKESKADDLAREAAAREAAERRMDEGGHDTPVPDAPEEAGGGSKPKARPDVDFTIVGRLRDLMPHPLPHAELSGDRDGVELLPVAVRCLLAEEARGLRGKLQEGLSRVIPKERSHVKDILWAFLMGGRGQLRTLTDLRRDEVHALTRLVLRVQENPALSLTHEVSRRWRRGDPLSDVYYFLTALRELTPENVPDPEIARDLRRVLRYATYADSWNMVNPNNAGDRQSHFDAAAPCSFAVRTREGWGKTITIAPTAEEGSSTITGLGTGDEVFALSDAKPRVLGRSLQIPTFLGMKLPKTIILTADGEVEGCTSPCIVVLREGEKITLVDRGLSTPVYLQQGGHRIEYDPFPRLRGARS